MNTYDNVVKQYVNSCVSVVPLLIFTIAPIFMLYITMMLERQVRTLEHAVEKYKRKYFTLKNSLFNSNNDDDMSDPSESDGDNMPPLEADPDYVSDSDDDMPELVPSDNDDTDDDMPDLVNPDGSVFKEGQDNSYDMPHLEVESIEQPVNVTSQTVVEKVVQLTS